MLAETPRSSGADVVLCRFNNMGGVAWTRALTNIGDDHADALALMPAGGAALACSLFNSTSQVSSEFVKRYDSNGNIVFSFGPVQPGFRATRMVSASDNSIYVAGTINSGLRVLHLSSSGALVWSCDIAASSIGGDDSAAAIALDAAGNTYVAGGLYNGSAVVPVLWQIGPTGNLAFADSIDVPGQDFGAAKAMLVDPKGPVFVAGTSDEGGTSRGWLASFDSSGNQAWVQTTAESGFFGEDISAIALDPFERVIVAGSAMTSPTNQDMYIARYATDSTPIWSTTYDGPGDAADAASWLAVDAWGSIFVGGTSENSAGRQDYAVLKLAPTGVPYWPSSGDVFYDGAAIFDGDGVSGSVPCGLGLDSRGFAYIGGSSVGTSGYDGNVVKYGPTDNASFVSQTVPASMVAGWSYTVSTTFQNTGNTVWTNTGDYKLGSQNPTDNSTWGFNRVSIPFGTSISGGQSYPFSFKVTAPINSGTYNFQWRLRNSLNYFGAPSINLPVTVTELPDAALYVSQTIPSSVKAGSSFTVSVKMRNVGSNAWTSNAYSLDSAPGFSNWGMPVVSLASSESIAHGAYKTFTITCVAPAKTGSYKMQWQMAGPSGLFDQVTPVKTISVS